MDATARDIDDGYVDTAVACHVTQQLESMGVAMIMLEDQARPRRCGHYDGKVILPGVVTHSTNVIEHPELVADRIVRFAEAVGRENVVASTDCGLGGRVHPQIAWAKMDTLVKGAELATRRLWG